MRFLCLAMVVFHLSMVYMIVYVAIFFTMEVLNFLTFVHFSLVQCYSLEVCLK